MCLLLALYYDCFFRQLLLRQLLLGWLLLRLLLPRLLLFRWLLFRLLLFRCQLLILTKLSQEKLDAQTTLTFYLLVAQASSFLIHPVRIQSIRLHLVTYPLLQHLYGLQDIMPFHWSSGASHPTLTQRSRGFPQGW